MPKEHSLVSISTDIPKEFKEMGVAGIADKGGPCFYCGNATFFVFPPRVTTGVYLTWVYACMDCRGNGKLN